MSTSTTTKILFTPGPLTTSPKTKQAMLYDLGARDNDCIALIQNLRARVLDAAAVSAQDYQCVLMQGAGTFAVEAVVCSLASRQQGWLVISNGVYGRRFANIIERQQLPLTHLALADDEWPDSNTVADILQQSPTIQNIVMVHCETTTGILNPIEAMGKLAQHMNKTFIVDAMSSFGGIPIDFKRCAIDVLISSPNKCFHSVPGFAFVIVKTEKLLAMSGGGASLCLDLYSQWQGFETNGQFRFTPPIPALLAFEAALDEWFQQGGVTQRYLRYQNNAKQIQKGMRALAFENYLADEKQSPIIITYRYPNAPRFCFDAFYRYLNAEGYVIYPGKLTHTNTFRIGCIGEINTAHITGLMTAIKKKLQSDG